MAGLGRFCRFMFYDPVIIVGVFLLLSAVPGQFLTYLLISLVYIIFIAILIYYNDPLNLIIIIISSSYHISQ